MENQIDRVCCSIVLAFVWALCPTQAGAGEAGGAVGRLFQLVEIERLEGAAVGFEGQPGDFWKLSKEFERDATTDELEQLVDSQRSVERAMGLLVLVRTKPEIGVARVLAHLTDSGSFMYFPGGCTGWRASVGEFCLALLKDANHLDVGTNKRPLLEARKLLGLQIGLVYNDAAVSIRHECSRDLTAALKSGTLAWDLEKMKGVTFIEAFKVIKALGRLEPSEPGRRFFSASLADGSLPLGARLAAASALTRDAHPDALAAIEAQRAFIETKASVGDYERLLADVEAVRIHAERMRAIHAESTWMGMEKIKATVIQMLTSVHPCALEDQEWSLGLAIVGDHPDARAALGIGLVGQIEGIKRVRPRWDTWSDLGQHLALVFERRRDSESLPPLAWWFLLWSVGMV